MWQGITYRAGESVVVQQIAGTIKPKDTGIRVEVYLSAGKTGKIVKGVVSPFRFSLKEEEPIQTALVLWDRQQWAGTDGTDPSTE